MSARGVLYALTAITMVSLGQTLLKAGMTCVGPLGLQDLRAPLTLIKRIGRRRKVLMGLALYVASAAFWILALTMMPLSVAYPLLALSYLAVALTSAGWLKESPVPLHWLGVLLIVVGITLVSLSAR